MPSAALITGSLSHLAGGLFYSARIPANRMAAEGHSPTVYGLHDSGWGASAADWCVSRITAYRTIGPARAGIAPRMIGDLKHGGHALVHLRGLWAFPSFAASTVRRVGTPLIVSPEGMLDPWALSQSVARKNLALRLFERENLQKAIVLHALSESELSHIRAFGLANPVAIIPNGVDMPIAPCAPNGRRRDPRVVLFLGRIHAKKGLVELVEAWSDALKVAPELRGAWRFHIAGWDDGGHEVELRRRIRTLQLDEDFVFLGRVHGEAKERAYREASAFILPSQGEGLPIAALEAATFGIPLLLTRQCNLPEFFTEGGALPISIERKAFGGMLVSHLSLGIERLEEVGRSARRLVRQRFGWSKITEQYMALYEWAVRGGAPASILDLR